METVFSVTGTTKEEKYRSLYAVIVALTQGETDIIANMANIAAAIKEVFGFLWVGFYRVDGDELVLGPFQGAVACIRIKKGKGVCGASWAKAKSIIVPDFDETDEKYLSQIVEVVNRKP
jgi:GAF domain-containing protein